MIVIISIQYINSDKMLKVLIFTRQLGNGHCKATVTKTRLLNCFSEIVFILFILLYLNQIFSVF